MPADPVERSVRSVSSRAFLSAFAVLAALAMGLTAAPARADTVPNGSEPETVSSDALATVQVDGVVWSQVVVGNTVYVGGNFTTARPAGAAPGVSTTPRSYLLAYNITTGELINSFAPTLDAPVLGVAASPDGTRVYAVGDFTKVNGLNRYRAVAFNTSTGAVIPSFSPGISARTRSIVATNDTVYVGGSFTNVSGVTRTRIAAIRASNGAVLDWAPSAAGGGNQVMALALTPDRSKLIIGGNYTTLNGNSALGLGAVDPVTGGTVPWNAANTIKNSGLASAITSLVAANDSIYGTGYVSGTDAGLPKGNLEGSFAASANSGDIRWLSSCHGDSYAVFPFNGASYSVGHPHDCRDIRGFPQTNPWTFQRALAVTDYATQTSRKNIIAGYFNWEGMQSPSEIPWYPDLEAGTFTGQQQAAWSISGNSDYLVLGGEFQRVNGVRQQGLVRFARKGLAPNKSGPQLSGPNYVPTLTSPATGVVRGSIPANYDSDNEELSYKVFRQGTAAPIYSTTLRSRFWKRPMITFADSSLTPGQVYRYRVEVIDPLGNTRTGDWTQVTVAEAGSASAYAGAVMDDGPNFYWRFDESTGTTVNDAVGRMSGNRAGTISQGAAGAIQGDPNTAYAFAGGSSGSRVNTATQLPDQQEFAAEAWIKTASNAGGRIIGFSNGTTGNSGKSDRHVYMRNDGKLTFGVAADSLQTITSPKSYNDNKFHHVVAQMSVNGMELFVDGVKVASNPSAFAAIEYNAYWRIGGDGLTGWPARPSSDYFAGTIDEVALYPQALTQAQISKHWSLSGWGVPLPNQVPTAGFTTSANKLTVSFSGLSSTDPDGSIDSYVWDFGDGTFGAGPNPSHTYADEGTFTARLTVTDNNGATAELSKQVTVTNPNTVPIAAFGAATNDLTASFDASASNDPDGSVVSYDWNFGDGATGSGVATVRTYAAAGTYNVTLTITDDRGATAQQTKQVAVAAPTPAIAADAFARSVVNGWGTADKGGAWTLVGTASNFAVAGGVGSMSTPPGNTRSATLAGISSTATDTSVDVAVNVTDSSTYISVLGRRTNATNDYRAKLRFYPNGDVNVTLVRVVNGAETSLVGGKIQGITYSSNDVLRVRTQVIGTAPTALRVKVWRVVDPEPSGWTYQFSDSTAALQSAGAVGVLTYASSSGGGTPANAKFSNLVVLPVSG